MAVLVIPCHGATGSLARLEDASPNHLIDVERQAVLDHGSTGATMWFGHVLR